MKASIAAIAVMLSVAMASPAEPATTSLPPLPAGDGLYVGTVNEAGDFSWEHQGNVEPATLSSRAELNPDVVDEVVDEEVDENPDDHVETSLEKRWNGPRCAHFRAGSANDVYAAVNALIDGCHSTRFTRSIAFQRGGVIAYGCNYGRRQLCNGGQVARLFNSIYRTCGVENAGWYKKTTWLASYGYTRAGLPFC